MDVTSLSQTSASALVAFLNSHSSESFTYKDVQWLFQIPRVAQVLNRVLPTTLSGSECVLGIDELDIYDVANQGEHCERRPTANEQDIRRDVDSMTVQRELLKRHVESLEGRLNTLDNFSNAKVSAIGGDPDELSLKFEEVSEQLKTQKTSLSKEFNSLLSSLKRDSNPIWAYSDAKHVHDMFSTDDALLTALEKLSNAITTSNEDKNLASDIDAIGSQLAYVQFQLFTAQISHAYLTSLTQPPTPSRNQTNTAINSLSDLKTLQNELDALVSHCEEATQLLTKQIVMDKVSDTIMRDNIDQMEKELDGVEKIEDTLEGMIGRLTTARELLELEISKINASGHLFSQLSRDLPNDGAVQAKEKSSRKVQEGIDVKEMLILQTLVGIRNPDDIQKILEKSYKLEQGLYETGLESVRSTMEETEGIVEPLVEAVYADSATHDIKYIDSDLIAQVRALEQRMDEIKRGMSNISRDTGVSAQATHFVEKWG